MTANSLYALFGPTTAFFSVDTMAYFVLELLGSFFRWFGLIVLVHTMCALADLQIPREQEKLR
jgi:hypothetical protein